MDTILILVIAVIGLAIIFDFLNGFHDSANSIATLVVTKTHTPGQAVLMAGVANFVGYFTFGVAIAKTVGKGIVCTEHITLTVVLAALVGAIIWNIITWLLGLPTSSSHALIGGLVGSAIAAAGFKAVIFTGVIKIVIFIFMAPLIGMAAASVFTIAILWIFRRVTPKKANSIFKKLQLLSSFCYSVGHGTNDAQKSMGIIALALFTGGVTASFQLDSWVVISCYAAISLGTMMGGWRIVKTMGTKIIKIRPMEGFSSETASAIVLIGTAHFGIPVSTTHVIAGSIMGVGAIEKGAGVRWITARRIIWAWFLTIPLTALCSAITYFVLSFFFQ